MKTPGSLKDCIDSAKVSWKENIICDMFQVMQWLSRFFAAERPVSNVGMFNKSSKSLFSFTTDASDISNDP